jgi:hypothetical protein
MLSLGFARRLLQHEAKETIMKVEKTLPANTKDAGNVRLGGESPSFGPLKASDRK